MNAVETTGMSVSSPFNRQTSRGLDATVFDWLAYQEIHLTLRLLPGEEPAELARRLALALRDREASIVRHEIFGAITAQPEMIAALTHEFGSLGWPVTWVEGAAAIDQSIAGMHVFAVAGISVSTLDLHGRPIGRVFSDGSAKHCLLGDVRSLSLSRSKPEQCRETFELLEHALGEIGMGMANVVRTWFCLEDILSWYKPFNHIRNEFYQQRKIFDGLLPASTGIGGRNPAGSAIVAGAWATKGLPGFVTVNEVLSPLQSSSLEYGSAFSRAVIIADSNCRRLLISGTASIGMNGSSAHVGNLRGQISLSMEVVRQILVNSGFEFRDVTRATVYFKNVRDSLALDAWLTEHNLALRPLIAAQAVLCRSELLFEIELDCIMPIGKRSG